MLCATSCRKLFLKSVWSWQPRVVISLVGCECHMKNFHTTKIKCSCSSQQSADYFALYYEKLTCDNLKIMCLEGISTVCFLCVNGQILPSSILARLDGTIYGWSVPWRKGEDYCFIFRSVTMKFTAQRIKLGGFVFFFFNLGKYLKCVGWNQIVLLAVVSVVHMSGTLMHARTSK